MLGQIDPSISPPTVTALGVAALLLTLVVRTLWRQGDDWSTLVDSLRADAAAAREAEERCRERLAVLEQRIARLEETINRLGGHP